VKQPINENVHTYVIGDIHGSAKLLSVLITKIEAQLRENDIIVFLGDYIDGGPDTKDVISQLIALRQRYGNKTIFLKGNHEQWFSQTYHDHTKTSWVIGMQGLSTIKSYSTEAAVLIENEIRLIGLKLFQNEKIKPFSYKTFFESMPKDHLQFLIDDLKRYYEGDGLICTHSGINPKVPLSEQLDDDLYWNDPAEMMELWKGPQTLVIGHADTAAIDLSMEGKPIIKEYIVLLDTGADTRDILTAVRFPDREIIQSKGHKNE